MLGAEVSRFEAARLVKKACAEFLTGPPHLALHGHDIDADAKAVLKRISGIGRTSVRLTAAEAMVSALPADGWSILLADCILAEWQSRKHPEWNGNAQGVTDRAIEAEEALSRIRSFIGSPKLGEVGSSNLEEEALRVLQSAIAMKQRLARDHLQLFSRKKTVDACRALGVAWICDSLTVCCQRFGGIAEPRYVAAIATAALDLGEVTENAARKTVQFSDRLRALRETPARSAIKN